jgi:putative proteasome-type protease
VMIYSQSSFSAEQQYRITEQHPHFMALRQAWSEGLVQLFNRLPPLLLKQG